MNIKSLVVGIATAASLGSTANANLVANGSLERNDTIDSVYINSYPTGSIPSWAVHGAAPTAPFNAVYIHDVLGGSLPAYMPPSYYSCTAALGFVTGNSCPNPDGSGHFINLDGDPNFPAAISQSIFGLVMGQIYDLSFSWAAVERDDQNGPTTGNFLEVSLGNEHFSTTSRNLPSKGFSGWATEHHVFTWNGATTDVLNFLAHGNPSGLPPSINLDGISLNAVPEPSSLALLIAAGVGLVGVGARRRRQTVVAD